jgi:tryptophan 2,3-dioxygenase
MELTPEIIERLKKLAAKYDAMGQDISSYLDGLLYADYLTYWDYIDLDVLLTLQKPKTSFPDEMVFIVYHQITELYFKLSLHEMHQISHNGKKILKNGKDDGWNEILSVEFFIERLKRVNNYFKALTSSFEIMVQGMEKEQFLRFRMALLPSSGFQSFQYRKIEVVATIFNNLIDKNKKEELAKETSIEKLYKHIYWKKGATELATGKKTLTLRQFEEKYSNHLILTAKKYKDRNLWAKYLSLEESDRKSSSLINELKQFDVNVNINWPLMHYKSAVRYLQRNPDTIAATGGTNWQKYLPPRFQKRIFYPDLWTDEEKENWGKSWVEDLIINKN